MDAVLTVAIDIYTECIKNVDNFETALDFTNPFIYVMKFLININCFRKDH